MRACLDRCGEVEMLEQPKLVVVTSEASLCIHHWVLGEPLGGRIMGRCRKCDASREYAASPQSTDRFDDYRELVAASAYQDRLSA